MPYTRLVSTISIYKSAILKITFVFWIIVFFNIIQPSEGQTQVPSREYVVHIKIGASVPNLQSSIRATYEPDILLINQTDPGIHINSTVTWINEDESFHTVTYGDIIKGPIKNPGKDFDSGILPPKFSWSHTFSAVGNYSYYCTIHPYMKGSVRVQ